MVVSGLFSWVLPYMLPKEYAAIQYIFSACLFAPLLYTLSEVSSIGIAISKKTRYSMYSSVIAVIINAIGNYLLVPILGAIGAAISTALSFFVFFLLRTEFSKKVWRKYNTSKAYILVFMVLLASISDALVFQGSASSLLLWGGLLISGLFFFKGTINLLLKWIKFKLYSNI